MALSSPLIKISQTFTGTSVRLRNYDGGGMEGRCVYPSILTGRRAASSPVNYYKISDSRAQEGDATTMSTIMLPDKRARLPQ